MKKFTFLVLTLIIVSSTVFSQTEGVVNETNPANLNYQASEEPSLTNLEPVIQNRSGANDVIISDNAFLKGVEVKKINTILLLVVSIATGICVSIIGPIGFVGLVTPHIIRTLYKKSADRLIVPIFFYSGIFLVLSDFISRNLGTNTDIPIGIITSFIGGPFFIYLIVK
jgi:iron complex transport system permease protein